MNCVYRITALALLCLLSVNTVARESLETLPDSHFAVQLIALPEKADLESLVIELGVTDLHAARLQSGEEIRYALFMGFYANRDEAEQAVEDRAAPLKRFTPWIRPVKSLKPLVLTADPAQAD